MNQKNPRGLGLRLAVSLLVSISGVSHAASYTLNQDGFQDGGQITGFFEGNDLNADGRISFSDGEVGAFSLSFNGNSVVRAFTHGLEDLIGLNWQLNGGTGGVLGDQGEPWADAAEGLASNWLPDDLVLEGQELTGQSFAVGMGPLGEMRAEVHDWSTGAKLQSLNAMTATPVPESSTAAMLGLGLLAIGLMGWRRRRESLRMTGLLAGVALSLSGAAGVANAQSAVVMQQNFATNGLGSFSPFGLVSVNSLGARLIGSAWSTDGMLTSSRLSTAGFNNLTLSYARSCGAGLGSDEGLVAEYAIQGGSYVRLEMARDTALAPASFTLPAEAANAALNLRFRVIGNAGTDNCVVNNVVLSGSVGPVSNVRPLVGKFTTFESGQVRPLALSADGRRLYAVNTPDNRVEVFDVSGVKPLLVESIPVGLEPVAVALAPDGRLWVVNHLSDSISIVDVSSGPGRVVNTLLVGDEPRDVIFAGTGNRLAFITAAHRGQNVKFDAQLSTPGIGRADVWVFDAASQGGALGGTPITVLNMFGDTLRALARNADGSRVYAAVLNSGNRSTVLDEDVAGGGLQKAPPFTSAEAVTQPRTGLIVQKNAAGDWMDSGDAKSATAPKKWNSKVKLDLPDYDVFTIDASAATPAVIGRTSGVGTTLFNMAVNPASGKLYVSNQEALNLNRFEGPGTRSSTVRGHFVESRVTVIDGGNVLPRHLNKHITSYGAASGTAAEKSASLATPLEMAVTPDGSRLYLVAMGSDKLARLGTAALESNTFTPSAADHLLLTGGGPTGLVLDAARNRAYVLTRYDNGISVVGTDVFAELSHVRMFNPEPAEVVKGRRFLYDARLTSSRGDSSCAGCHVFGDMDHLSWDLGNPDEMVQRSPNAYSANVPRGLRRTTFHPLKGPMSTQSLRGMFGNGPLHWRGDRTGQVNRAVGETLEERAFRDFNVAFTGLLGRDAQLTDAQMTSFAKYAMNLAYPPSPVARFDGTLTAQQSSGLNIYNTFQSTGLGACNSCHTLDVSKNRFGTSGLMSFEGDSIDEDFKVPHLRNMYQKVGMFVRNADRAGAVNLGPQIRGFGFDKSGGSGTIAEFLKADVFTLTDAQRADLEQMVLVMPSELSPIVGQQVTITPANAQQADVKARLTLLVQRATVASTKPECELVAKGVIGNEARGWVMNSAQSFVADRASESPVPLTALLSQISGPRSSVTFTCVPPGNGTRIGIDRDVNAVLDRP
jgi:DNA-binding beta-propeller fold protein YncE